MWVFLGSLRANHYGICFAGRHDSLALYFLFAELKICCGLRIIVILLNKEDCVSSAFNVEMNSLLVHDGDLSEKIGLRKICHPTSKLYRSRAPYSLSEADFRTLVDLGISRIFDLRRVEEVSASPLPNISGIRIFSAYANSQDSIPLLKMCMRPDPSIYPMDLVKAQYRSMGRQKDVIVGILKTIVEEETPALVCCRQAKDRTGVVACAAETIAGVSQKRIYDEYLYSNTINKQANEADIKALPRQSLGYRTLLFTSIAKKEYLDAFIREYNKLGDDSLMDAQLVAGIQKMIMSKDVDSIL